MTPKPSPLEPRSAVAAHLAGRVMQVVLQVAKERGGLTLTEVKGALRIINNTPLKIQLGKIAEFNSIFVSTD